MPFPKLDRFLTADGDLQPTLVKAREIRALSMLCDKFLPSELARQVRAANLKDGQLVLLAANSAAAAKLKLISETLCNYLSKQGAKVIGVSVRVQPRMSRSADAAPQKRAFMTPAVLAELRALYQRMPDSAARNALKALLARHTAGPRPPPTRARKTTAPEPRQRKKA